jgi:hypothetical protein
MRWTDDRAGGGAARRRSEQLTDEQLQLGLEDLEQAVAEQQAGQNAVEPNDNRPRAYRNFCVGGHTVTR